MPSSLPNTTERPPGGYRYVQPETGQRLEAPNWAALLALVKKHRIANNLPIGLEFNREIEEALCAELEPGYCQDAQSHRPAFSLGLSFQAILDGTATLAAWFLQGRPKVTQEEADAHAAICTTCPENQPPQGCSACSWRRVEQLVGTVTGAGRTTSDGALQMCRQCGCSLRAKVWFPPTFLRERMSKERIEALPSHCWIKPPEMFIDL